MKRKHTLYWIIILFVGLVVVEIFLGLAFWIKDVKDITHQSSVKDAPYVYYTQKFDTQVLENKDPDKYRIALIGGSVARQLGQTNFLDSLLNLKLNTSCIEVLNAGIDGYVLEQEFILTQLHLQKYKPNLIFGLDGYNDLMAYKLNRYEVLSTLPPQNYRMFKVIEHGKMENKFIDRFASLFKNIKRFIFFIKRIVKNQSAYDYSNVTAEELNRYKDYYLHVIEDTRDFCKTKGINYQAFIQPMKFYDKSALDFTRTTAEDKKLNDLMYRIEVATSAKSYGHSLTSIFDSNLEVYTDHCHVNENGNLIFADKISDILVNEIKADTIFQKIIN